MSCVFDRSKESLEQLEQMGANRHYADCKTVIDIGVQELTRDVYDAKELLHRLLAQLYAKPYLTRLFHHSDLHL